MVYAGTPEAPVKLIRVTSVRPLADYKLFLGFSTGEQKIYDCANLLDKPVFRPLKDKAVFDSVYLDGGAPVWNNGEIDIDPECLYENSKDI
ncbi:MAG: DUF2442 domain-containing protein [Candidatus Margulisbacteria bacterium]|nr:DUF2442 domain-containing protein [Candidatus Margulisiibacteriota bacterium]